MTLTVCNSHFINEKLKIRGNSKRGVMSEISQLGHGRIWTTEQAVYLGDSRMTISNIIDPENREVFGSRKVAWDYAKQTLPITEHLVISCFLHVSGTSIFRSKGSLILQDPTDVLRGVHPKPHINCDRYTHIISRWLVIIFSRIFIAQRLISSIYKRPTHLCSLV